jgi:prolipoprotein diacylglyceryltransferase/protein-S-isoprenylcysteine O-methyltransferase Ste14
VNALETARRVGYGALFVVVLPLGLLLWADTLAPVVKLPAVSSVPAGLAAAAAGIALLAAGIGGLMIHGRGLPMNAFPPPRFVRRGIYRWIRSPIYLGFGLACTGIAIATGSAAGLWIVTPTMALGAAALVHGYERHDLVRRFGPEARQPPLLSLPGGGMEPPTRSQRVAVYLWVLLPWLVAYFAVQALGRPRDAFTTSLPLERDWPVWQWTEVLYFSAYLIVPLTPLLVRSSRDLRRFAIQGLIGTVVITLCWLAVPVVAANRPFVPFNAAGRLLSFEQATSAGVAAFPAFHALWALFAAQGLAANSRPGGARSWRTLAWGWATVVVLSCLTTGAHTLVEVIAALLLYGLLRDLPGTWSVIRRWTERLANSWREWRLGPIRIINHGLWAALAAGTGVLLAAAAVGRERSPAVIVLALGALLGAGLWAQVLEGSSKLLRPFGWYGGVLGGVIAAFVCSLADVPVLALLAALSVAAPWIQIFGRMRCLVQGCCHGGPTVAEAGIRYRHRRSRVTQLANLADVPVHATPLYSIGANLLIGVVMIRLKTLPTPDAMLLGIYLMLSGCARFVEESYRAEPQTPVVGGLRIYQWLALLSVVAGALCTVLPSEPARPGFEAPGAMLWLAAVGMALVGGAAMGLDFPGSSRRFSRLAAADQSGEGV